jgi:taurine transport system substrate-binding protein
MFVARDEKLFEKAGLAPTFVKFVAGPPMIAAAREKSIDVADLGSVPFLIGLAQGVDWAMIGISTEGAYSEGIVARKDSGITTIGDLRGKRIGYFRGSTSHYGLIMALRQQGIRPDQVTLIDMPPLEQLTALANKDIDASEVWEPWVQRMVHEANARIIATEGDFGIYTNVTVYAARRDWLRDNRETAVRFLRALLMAYDLLQKDPAIGVRTVAREMGLKEAWTRTIYENAPPPNIYWWTDHGYRYSLAEDSGFHRRLGYLARFLLEQRLIQKEADVDEALDASVISEALKTWKTGQ